MGKTIDVKSSGSGWPPEEPAGGPPGGGGKGPRRMRRGGGGDRPPLVVTVAAGLLGLVVLLAILMGLTGNLGVTNVSPQEVAVVVNYVTGKREVVTRPGIRIYVPFLQDVFIFDKSQQKFLMEGSQERGPSHGPQLTVRASDGSSFYFEEMPILYEIVPASADVVLDDSGPGAAFKEEWVRSHARSILRDEFGRFTAVEAANPTVFDQARAKAQERLNEFLEPHGIRVVLIGTPNPKFDAAYEQAIEDRKAADQEVERLRARKEQLEQEKLQRLAAVEREKSVEMQTLEGDLVKKERAAEVEQIQIQRSADAYVAQRVAEGEAMRSELVAQAGGLTEKYKREAEGITAKALALAQRGEVVVREALVEKLLNVKFTIVPYSRDSVPKRLEHVDARGAVNVDPQLLGGDE